jgi:hypothetical protein
LLDFRDGRSGFCKDVALFFDAFDMRSCRNSGACAALVQLNAAAALTIGPVLLQNSFREG